MVFVLLVAHTDWGKSGKSSGISPLEITRELGIYQQCQEVRQALTTSDSALQGKSPTVRLMETFLGKISFLL